MFRFTLREIILATLAAAVAVGWWVDHRKHAELLMQQKQKDLREIRNLQLAVASLTSQLAMLQLQQRLLENAE